MDPLLWNLIYMYHGYRSHVTICLCLYSYSSVRCKATAWLCIPHFGPTSWLSVHVPWPPNIRSNNIIVERGILYAVESLHIPLALLENNVESLSWHRWTVGIVFCAVSIVSKRNRLFFPVFFSFCSCAKTIASMANRFPAWRIFILVSLRVKGSGLE